MSQIEAVVKLSRTLESLLEQKYQATGKGLHEKVTSVEAQLPEALVKQLRYIATIRNSVVHEDGFVVPDLMKFTAAGDAAVLELGGKPDTSSSPATSAASPEWVFYVEMSLLAAFSTFGGVVGIWKLGIWPGALGIVGGAFLALLAISEEAKKFYKTAAEFIGGLFILICVGTLGSAVWKWLS